MMKMHFPCPLLLLHTLENRNQLANHGEPTRPQILACGHLLEKDGDSAGKHGDEIDDQEGATAIFVAQIREPPNV